MCFVTTVLDQDLRKPGAAVSTLQAFQLKAIAVRTFTTIFEMAKFRSLYVIQFYKFGRDFKKVLLSKNLGCLKIIRRIPKT